MLNIIREAPGPLQKCHYGKSDPVPDYSCGNFCGLQLLFGSIVVMINLTAGDKVDWLFALASKQFDISLLSRQYNRKSNC